MLLLSNVLTPHTFRYFCKIGIKLFVIVCPTDLTTILKSNIFLRGKLLVKEEIDLMNVKVPYLLVKNLEDWMEEDILTQFFQEITSNEVKSFALLNDTTAKLTFADPNGMSIITLLN